MRADNLGVAKDGRPFAENEIGRHDRRGALIETAGQVEQELPAGLGERQIAELVENDEVHPGEIAVSRPGPAFGFEPVDEIDGVEEAATRSCSDAASRHGDRQMDFACPCSADEDDVALLSN